jgi:hypothetical protein
MNFKRLLAASCMALLLAATLPANATVIGVAVGSNGSLGNPVGTSSNGTISFYALLNGSGTYGVGGAGLTSDTCTIGFFSSSCTGGRLDMWLRFAPVTLGANILTLQFTDLDLFGVNDPSYFLESVSIFDSSLTKLAFVDSALDPEVVQANYNQQTLSLALNVANNPYFTRLTFRTAFNGASRGTYANTIETLLATMTAVPPPPPPTTSVPEPDALSLLGAGLLLVGFAVRRKPSRDVATRL